MIRSTPPSVSERTCFGPVGLACVDGVMCAEFRQFRPARIVGRRADHDAGAQMARDLLAHQADAAAGAEDQDAVAGAHAAILNERIMHGLERQWQGSRRGRNRIPRGSAAPADNR